MGMRTEELGQSTTRTRRTSRTRPSQLELPLPRQRLRRQSHLRQLEATTELQPQRRRLPSTATTSSPLQELQGATTRPPAPLGATKLGFDASAAMQHLSAPQSWLHHHDDEIEASTTNLLTPVMLLLPVAPAAPHGARVRCQARRRCCHHWLHMPGVPPMLSSLAVNFATLAASFARLTRPRAPAAAEVHRLTAPAPAPQHRCSPARHSACSTAAGRP